MIFTGPNDLIEENQFKVNAAARVNCAPKRLALGKILSQKRYQTFNAIFLELVSVEWFYADYGTKKHEAEECVKFEKAGLIF